MAASWKFILTDLVGNVLGEVLECDSRVVNIPLNRVPTASFSVRTDNYLTKYLADHTWDGLLKCYRNNSLVYIGNIVGSDDQYDTSNNIQRLAVTSSAPFWRLSYRQLGTTATGFAYDATGTNMQDAVSKIMDQVLTGSTGSSSASPTHFPGIIMSTATTTTAAGATIGTYYFKPAADAIVELSNGTFDFEVVPQEPTFNYGGNQVWPLIGKLRLADVIGVTNTKVAFTFGLPGKNNLVSYGRTIDRSGLANDGFIMQPGASDHSGVIEQLDAASVAARGLFQAVIDDGGVEWNALRTTLVQEAVALRKQARQIIAIQPHPDCGYDALVDYNIGDSVQVALKLNKNLIFNGVTRIWGVTFAIDKNNVETQSLQTIPS